MSEGDWGLPDVGYSGFTDTTDGFSDSTTLQDTVVGSPNITLGDPSSLYADASITDAIDGNLDPYSTQALSGTTDPPIGSQVQSQPSPVYGPANSNTNNALNALSKFGYTFAALLGGTTHTSMNGTPTGSLSSGVPRPVTSAPFSGSSTSVLVIVAVALIALIAFGKGGE